MNKEIKTAQLETINNNDYDKSINKLIKKIEMNQKECKYMSGQLCKLLKEVKEDFITLQTPFDIVYIKLKKNKKSETEIEETEVHAGPWSSYVKLSEKIEELIPDKQERINALQKIYKYLSILKDENIKSIKQFNDKIKNAFGVKNTNQYNECGENIGIKKKDTEAEEHEMKKNLSLAYLSAILMISEPFRFNDGGGLSRGAIRYIYINLTSNNDNNAISNALGGEIDDDKLLFSTEGGKSAVNNIIKKHQNSKKDKNNNVDENYDNLKNMKLEYVSDDESEDEGEDKNENEDNEDNNKKEYSLRSKGLSEEEKQIYGNSFHGKLGKFIKNKKANMRTNIRKNRKINRRSRKINRKRTRGNKSKSKIKKQK